MKCPEDSLILVEACCPVILSVSTTNQRFADVNKIFLYNIRKDQLHALIDTTPLFYVLVPTCFGSRMP
jgi:hypothetical protein